MIHRHRPKYSCALGALFAWPCAILAQVEYDDPPLCAHAHEDAGFSTASAATVEIVSWSTIPGAAIVLEYSSIFDVHTAINPNLPLRSQPGSFHSNQILHDLACVLDASSIHFVLMYSIQELPGWLHAGPRGIVAPAINIGFPNSQYGAKPTFADWPKLLSAPHMNSVNLIIEDTPDDFGLLAAMHEMGHAWGVFWAQQSPGPRDWETSDPIAWLGACCSHWSYNWVDPAMPGMMYSAPTEAMFNDFDLYAMGLRSYDQIANTMYEIHEDMGTSAPGPTHQLGVDDLIASLAVRGGDYFYGDGQRFPALDEEVAELRVVLVIVKGENETLTLQQQGAIAIMANDLPGAWSEATGGSSVLTVVSEPFQSVDNDTDGVLNCEDNCVATSNPSQTNIDNDAMGDACDPCPHVSHPSYWDLDRQPDFTLRDISIFQNCFSGNQPVSPACAFADFSGGEKIDLSDYIPLGELLTGECD